MSDDVNSTFGANFEQAFFRGDWYYQNPKLDARPKPEGVTTNTITAVPFGPATTRDAAIYYAQAVQDAGNHMFISGMYVRGNEVKGQIWLVDSSQTIMNYWEVVPQGNAAGANKWDSFHIQIAGSDLHCWGSCHVAISGPRDNTIMYAMLPGVVPTPYPHGVVQEGAPFDMTNFGGITPTPSPTPGPSADDIATATLAKLVGELSNIHSLFYASLASLVGETTHHAIQSEVTNATGALRGLAHTSDLTNLNLHDGGTRIADSLYSRLDDSLAEHGLPKGGK